MKKTVKIKYVYLAFAEYTATLDLPEEADNDQKAEAIEAEVKLMKWWPQPYELRAALENGYASITELPNK